MSKLSYKFILLGLIIFMTKAEFNRCIYSAETKTGVESELTVQKREEIDALLKQADEDPRKNAIKNFFIIEKMGPEALHYAMPKIAEYLHKPIEIDTFSNFDEQLMQAMRLMRSVKSLEERHVKRLIEITKADNKDHATWEKIILGTPAWQKEMSNGTQSDSNLITPTR